MAVAGIIAEYNPFHLGHQWQIQELRRILGQDTAVICAMSGNWVQRGDSAIMEKHLRAELAVQGGANLILELPLTWATASAERFAQGGISLLSATGIVDTLVFGSESGDLSRLEKAAAFLQSESCNEAICTALKSGVSYAAARQKAMDAALGTQSWDTRSRPNDQLALEYLKALTGTGITPLAIQRRGAAHDGEEQEGFASASALRKRMLAGQDISSLIPEGTILPPYSDLASLQWNERAVLSALRTASTRDYLALPDVSEGLEQRLMRAAEQSCSLEAFYAAAKTKRYAWSRLRRIAVWRYLGLTRTDFSQELPYIRVLAADKRGLALLHTMKKTASLPVLTKPAAAKKISAIAMQHMEMEAKSTDLWQLCRNVPGPCGTEWTGSIHPIL